MSRVWSNLPTIHRHGARGLQEAAGDPEGCGALHTLQMLPASKAKVHKGYGF